MSTTHKSSLLIVLCYSLLIINSCSHKTEKTTTLTHPWILTKEQWKEDLDELYFNLKSKHRNLFHSHSKEDFDNLYEEIKSNISSKSDHEIIIEFAKLVALASDGHTRLTLPLQKGIGLNQTHSSTPLPSDSSLVLKHLPVEFYWFDDGIHIIRATPKYRSLIGKKVLQINSVPIDTLLENVRPICHYDNEMGFKLIAPTRISILEVLQSIGITDSLDVDMLIENNNKLETITLTALNRFTNEKFFDTKEDFKLQVVSMKNSSRNYWFEYIETKKTVFVQINKMNDIEDGPDLISFIRIVNKFINKNEVDRIILDLRNNFGGDNVYSLPIVDLIVKNPDLNQIGKFYTLIGRKTFSAAQYLVNDLRKWTNVIFVGEPTGASPNSYGDSRKTQLRNSNLTTRISTIYWRDYTSNETQKWIAPDLHAPNNAADFFNNKDIALETCFNFEPSKNIKETYVELYKYGGMETAERLYLRVALDWSRDSTEIKLVENQLIEWMSEE